MVKFTTPEQHQQFATMCCCCCAYTQTHPTPQTHLTQVTGLKQDIPTHLLCCVARHARLPPDERISLIQQPRSIAARLVDHPPSQTIWLLQQSLQKMLCLHDLLGIFRGDLGCCYDRLPGLICEFGLGDALAAAAAGLCAGCEAAPWATALSSKQRD
jgi:hypothetical protein